MQKSGIPILVSLEPSHLLDTYEHWYAYPHQRGLVGGSTYFICSAYINILSYWYAFFQIYSY